jgi:hypothetical protein
MNHMGKMSVNQGDRTVNAVPEVPKTATTGHIAPQHLRPKIRYRPWFRKLVEEQNERDEFFDYCVRAAGGARTRSKRLGLPCDIDTAYLGRLLLQQKYCCAVTGIPLELTRPQDRTYHRDAFGPSLDRMVPAKGYVRGNVRITCSIVNIAMNEWGLEALLRVAAALRKKRCAPRD